MAWSCTAASRRLAAALLWALLGALAGCGGGGEPEADAEARVADGRVPLRYEVTGLQGSGGYVLVSVSSPSGGGDFLRIPLNANGSFQTDTDPFVEHSGVPDGLYPTDAAYRVLTQDSWHPSNPTQFCAYSSGPPDTVVSPPQAIDTVLRIDCSTRPLHYEVRGLQGSGANLVLLFVSRTAGVIEYDLRLSANGQFTTDTDSLPGPQYVASDDPVQGSFPGFGDGRFPADTLVRPWTMTQPAGPAQACTVNGTLPDGNLRPGRPVSEPLVIDCSAQPLRYEVRGLQGLGGSVLLRLESPTLGVIEYPLQLKTNGSFATHTDDQPGPLVPGGVDPGTGQPLPGGGDGIFPADTQVRALEVAQPAGPPQICTVNGAMPKPSIAALHPLSDVLFIDCGSVYKTWRFDTDDTVRLPKPPGAGSHGEADSIEVARTFTYLHPELFGPAGPIGLFLGRAEQDIFANLLDQGGPNAGMYSSADGRTYWIATEAGNGPGTHTTIETRWGVRRIGDDPKFTLTLSALQLAGQMSEGSWYSPNPKLTSYASLEVRAHRVSTGPDGRDVVDTRPFHHQYDGIDLWGQQVAGGPKHWILSPLQYAVPGAPIFDDNFDKFVLTTSDGNGRTGNTGHAVLREPIGLSVNLTPLGKDERALIVVRSVVTTRNRFNNESLAVAYLRDPVGFDPGRNDQAMAVTEISGLAMFSPPALPADFEPQPDTTPAPACAAADAPRAQLQFGAATVAVDEDDPLAHAVTITRTGSSTGAVTARVLMSPGTATAGADYTPREFFVRFSDGDAAPRRIALPLVDDALVEGPETLTLSLVDVAGCADAGALSTTTVTLVDDEPAPPGPPSGTLDAGFGSAGQVASYGIGGAPAAMALQSDGRIVMAGGSTSDFVLARYLADGTLDASFGTGGVVTTDIAGSFQQEQAHAVLVQPDGRIVVAGTARPAGGGQTLVVALARYLPDGTLDATFGTGGKVFDAAQPGTAFAIALQPDGQLVIAGEAPVTGNPNDFSDLLLARYDASGRLDLGFGLGGRVVADVVGGNDRARNVLVLPDGRIVASGMESGLFNTEPTLVMQVLPDGRPDPAFGTQGKLRLTGALVGWALARQADGKLLLGGSSEFGPAARAAVLRLAADGSLDTGFGTGGLAVHPFTGNTDIARALVVQPDGRILVAGRTGGTNRNTAAVRLAADGTLDPTFATGGLLVVDFMLGAAGYPDEAERALLQPDGKLLLGGWARDSRNVIGYALVRLAP